MFKIHYNLYNLYVRIIIIEFNKLLNRLNSLLRIFYKFSRY